MIFVNTLRSFCWGEVIHISVWGRRHCNAYGVGSIFQFNLTIHMLSCSAVHTYFYCDLIWNNFCQAWNIWANWSFKGSVWQSCCILERFDRVVINIKKELWCFSKLKMCLCFGSCTVSYLILLWLPPQSSHMKAFSFHNMTTYKNFNSNVYC